MLQTLAATQWVARCTRRIIQIDRSIGEGEARRIARDLHRFERTRLMDPEVAVDFVMRQMAMARPQFERRSSNRA